MGGGGARFRPVNNTMTPNNTTIAVIPMMMRVSVSRVKPPLVVVFPRPPASSGSGSGAGCCMACGRQRNARGTRA